MKKLLTDPNFVYLLKAKPHLWPQIFFLITLGFLKRKTGQTRKTIKFAPRLSSMQAIACDDLLKKKKKQRFGADTSLSFTKTSHIDGEALKVANNHRSKFDLMMTPQNKGINSGDPEFVWSALQLNWLSYLVTTKSVNAIEASAYILGCARLISLPQFQKYRRPFTLSEIAFNILDLNNLDKSIKIPKEVDIFLGNVCNCLLRNLEIYRFQDPRCFNCTNNHLLHNLRALFSLAAYFGSSKVHDFADAIWRQYGVELFDDGLLDEGSIAYQVIASSVLNDIALHTDVESTVNTYRFVEFLDRMGFTERAQLPWIGDISPDPDVGYLLGRILSNNHYKRQTKEADRRLRVSDFNLINFKPWSLLYHIRLSHKHQQHAHNDLLAPIVYYQGHLVMPDVGRRTYQKSLGEPDTTRTSYHSIPMFNELDHSPRYFRDLYPRKELTLKTKEIDRDLAKVSRNITESDKLEYRVFVSYEVETFSTRLASATWQRSFGAIKTKQNDHESGFFVLDEIKVTRSADIVFNYFFNGKISRVGERFLLADMQICLSSTNSLFKIVSEEVVEGSDRYDHSCDIAKLSVNLKVNTSVQMLMRISKINV